MKAKLQWLKNGADVEEGQNVYLWENIDKSYEYVPKDGAVGLEAHQPYHKGSSITKGIYGNNGNGRETGAGLMNLLLQQLHLHQEKDQLVHHIQEEMVREDF